MTNDERTRAKLVKIAKYIDKEFAPQKMGFSLLVFEFGKAGTTQHVANVSRNDIVPLMEEWIKLSEGGRETIT